MRTTLLIPLALVVLFGAIAVAGLRSDRHLQGTNDLRPLVAAAGLSAGKTVCQAGETVPAGTGGVRLRAEGATAVTADVGGAHGRLAAGWAPGDVVIDVPETRATQRDARVCLTNHGPGVLTLFGEPFAPGIAAKVGGAPQPGRARIEYLRPGQDSWWALAGALTGRIAGARGAVPGAGTPYLWLGLALGVMAGSMLALRRPGSGWPIAALATANALAWGLIVPPFHVPDEPSHAFYAQYLGETGKLPQARGGTDWYSGDVTRALGATAFYRVIGETANRPAWDVDLPPDRDRVGTANASTASTNPPLYYLPQAVVYRAARGLGVLDRLALMRVLSALLGGLTALCVFAFLRELLPRSPLAATTGALLAGLMPQFAFITAGVNNDAGLYAVSAALFLALARVLRRGLTARRALACGLLLGAGVLVKTQMIAFAPAVVLALALAKGPRRWWAPAGAALVVPLAIYGVLGATIWKRPVLDRVDVLSASPRSGAILQQVSYAWQEYLPRLPVMSDLVPGVQPWSLWIRGLIGRFGWLDYGYPSWAYALGALILVATTAAAAWFAWPRRRSAVKELAVFGLAALGLLAAIAAVSYRAAPPFDQARYVLPLLPLFALVPALAVRAAGPRRAQLVAGLLVVAALAYSVFAQLLTVARYYG